MSYSFTEKKRIRKSFAKRASVLPIPFLLATQIESYAAFLQAQVEPDQRATQGLQVTPGTPALISLIMCWVFLRSMSRNVSSVVLLTLPRCAPKCD